MIARDAARPGGPALDSRSHIAKAAGIIMLGNIISRLLGLVREQVIVALFGLKAATDVFTAASTVPTMAYDLLVSGAISAALIPVFTDYAGSRHREEFSRVVSAVLTIAALALAIVVALLEFVAPWLVDILVGGFDPATRELTSYLVRLILPSVMFMGMAGILTATLYARQSFTLPAFSVAVYNLGVILGGVLLADRLGITSLVVGVLLGALFQVAIQIPGARGLRLRPSLDLSHPAVRSILKLYAPVALGIVITNLGVLLDRNLASRTGEGSIAAMRVATTLVQFSLGLIATATSFAVLPTLARQASGEPTHHSTLNTQHSSYATTLRMGMKMILVLIVPAVFGLVVLREPLIRLLFQRGAFDLEATRLTALAFLGYSPGIVFAAVDQLLIVAFYARKDTRTPVAVGVAALLVYLAVALSLIDALGMLGLVLANAAQTTFHAIVLLWLLNRQVRGVLDGQLATFLLKVIGASLFMALACQVALVWTAPLAETGPQTALLVAGLALLGLIAYGAGVAVLRVREAGTLWSALSARLGRLRR